MLNKSILSFVLSFSMLITPVTNGVGISIVSADSPTSMEVISSLPTEEDDGLLESTTTPSPTEVGDELQEETSTSPTEGDELQEETSSLPNEEDNELQEETSSFSTEAGDEQEETSSLPKEDGVLEETSPSSTEVNGDVLDNTGAYGEKESSTPVESTVSTEVTIPSPIQVNNNLPKEIEANTMAPYAMADNVYIDEDFEGYEAGEIIRAVGNDVTAAPNPVEKGQITYYAGRRTNAALINCIASITNGNDGQCLDINEDGYASSGRGISFTFNYAKSIPSISELRNEGALLELSMDVTSTQNFEITGFGEVPAVSEAHVQAVIDAVNNKQYLIITKANGDLILSSVKDLTSTGFTGATFYTNNTKAQIDNLKVMSRSADIGLVTVTVKDGSNAIAGVDVTIGEYTIQTDASGKAVFALPNGTYSVEASKAGYEHTAGKGDNAIENFTVSSTTEAVELTLLSQSYVKYPGEVSVSGGQNFIAAPKEGDPVKTTAFIFSVKDQMGIPMTPDEYGTTWSIYPAGTTKADPNVTIDGNGVVSVSRAFNTTNGVAAYEVTAQASTEDKYERASKTLYIGNCNIIYYDPINWEIPAATRNLTKNLDTAVSLPEVSSITLGLEYQSEPEKQSTIALLSNGGKLTGVQCLKDYTITAWTGWTGNSNMNQETDVGKFSESGIVSNGKVTEVTFTINRKTQTITVSCGTETVSMPFTVSADKITGLQYGLYRNGGALVVKNILIEEPNSDYLAITGDADFAKVSGQTVTREYTLGQTEIIPEETFSWNITGTDTTGVSIANGVLSVTDTAKAGTYTITATSNLNPGKTADLSVEIGDFQTIDPKKAVISGAGALTLESKGVAYSVATAIDSYGDDVAKLLPAAKWTSSNTNVVTITNDGKATAVGSGTATLTATITNGSAVSTLTKEVTVAAYYIIMDVSGNTTTVDTSALISNANVNGYQITTSKAGVLVKQTVVASVPASVDTTGADKLEIAPVFFYNMGSVGEHGELGAGYDIPIPAGTYNFIVTNTSGNRCDVYVNDQMLVNNILQGGSAVNSLAVKDIVLTDGVAKITTADYSSGQNANSVKIQVEVVKSPSIVERTKKIYVLGDSLVCIYYNGGDASHDLQTGWGQVLSDYLVDSVDVVNLANSGATANGLLGSAFSQVRESAKAGDVLILESGYNDRTYDTEAIMKNAVTTMANEAKAKGMEVILVSPNASAHDYKEAVAWTPFMADVAASTGATYVDLSKLSYDFLYATYGTDTTAVLNNYNVSDKLHSKYNGANKWASLVAQSLYEQGYQDLINADYVYSFTDTLGNTISCSATGKTAGNMVTVSFNMNGHGDAIKAVQLEKDSKLTAPKAPTAIGYLFEGWYTEKECTNVWDFDSGIVSKNMTLYAKWKQDGDAVEAWYSQDFSAVTNAGDVATSTNAQTQLVLAKDSEHGNYLAFDFSSLQSNSRGAYMDFAGLTVADKGNYIVEFDAAITPGSDQNTYFTVKGTDFAYIKTINDGAKSGYLINLVNTGKGGTEYTLNGTQKVTIPKGEWCHYKLYVDKTQKLVSVTINGSVTGSIADKTIVAYDGEGNVAGLYMLAGRYNAVQAVDNIVVRGVTADDSFGQVGAETLASAEFATQLNTTITQPAEGAAVHMPITIKANGNLGGDITDKVTVDWSVVGLEKEDGYISLTKAEGTGAGTEGAAPDGTTAYFNVRNGVSNYFGYVQAKVSYGDDSYIIKTPFAVIGGMGVDANRLAPAAGYYADMNDYVDSLVGYQGTAKEINEKDLVLNNWSIYGSNSARTLKLVKDADGTKALEFASNGGGGTTVAVYQWVDQSNQYVIDFTAKFTSGMAFGVYANTPNNSNNNPEWAASYAAGALTLGTESITGINANEWYRFVISADPSVQKVSIAVYDKTDAKIGEINDIDMTNDSSVQKYFCFYGTWPMYLASFEAYRPVLSTLVVGSGSDVVKVPEEGEKAATVDLSAILTSTEGIKMTGAVDWSLAEEYANVAVQPTGAQTAILTIEAGASGMITVVATKDGKQAEKVIRLTTSSNVVAFTQSTSSITIPFAGEKAVEYQFTAQTRDGLGNEIDGGQISYALLAKDGVTETTVKGVTFKNGLLTVEAGASPAVVYVKATNAEGLSTKVKVNIHGLSFAFGSAEAADGFTQVMDTLYTKKLGYGFRQTEGLTVNSDNVTGTSDFRFKANVPNGNYIVKVNTTAESVISEVVEEVSAVTGITKTGSSFNVAVCDGVLDLTFPASTSVKTIEISQAAAKSRLEKPMAYAIGDSTTKNNASGALSWGNCVEGGMVAVPEVFSGFANHGMAGRDSVSYYNQGRVEAVLLAICPGDYVTVNMGINSKETGEAAAYYTLMKNYYVEGILQRGGIPVIVTATPDGPVGNNVSIDYDAATGKFTNNRGDGARNNVLRQIAEEEKLNLIELGQWGEDWMNTLTMDDVTAYNAENNTAYTTVLEMVQSWYVDHNHYKEYLGIKIGNYLLGQLEELVLTTPMPDPDPDPAPGPDPTPDPDPKPDPDPTPDPDPSPEGIYEILNGGNQTIVSGRRTVTVSVNADYSKFTGVEVDGSTLAAEKYTIKDGSTIVTLNADYVSTLSVGKHTLKFNFTDGYAITSLTITSKSGSDNTDNSGDNDTDNSDDSVSDSEDSDTTDNSDNSTSKVTASVEASEQETLGDTTGTWKKDDKGWWYQKEDTSYPLADWLKINGEWYLFDTEGYMNTGWQKAKDKWYYLDQTTGSMQTGWLRASDSKWYYLDLVNGDMETGWFYAPDSKWYYFDPVNGDMKTGWIQTSDGKWYYLYADGSCAMNTITPDGYYVDQNGAWIK